MAKDYNIDDILSEVQKRRKENENEIKADAEEIELKLKLIDEIKPEPVVEDIEPKAEDEEEVIDISSGTENQNATAQEEPAQEELAQEIIDEAIDEEKPEDNQEEQDGFVDLVSLTEEEPELDEEPELIRSERPEKKKKSKSIAIRIICILLIIVIGAGVGTWLYIDSILNKVTDNDDNNQQVTQESIGMDQLVESFLPIEEADASNISSFQDMVKQWYKNGTPCSSSHVLNIMLIGEDTRGKNILDDGTRADSAIIASVNIDTKQIKLTSILRDTYAYWENPYGDESTGQFGKINGAMSTGDVNVYVQAVENLYKIKIDNYVIVNFTSFEKIIDTLGGVELELTTKEIYEINNHQKRYGHVTIEKKFDGDKGVQKLSGKEALAYCRIRKIDSDNMRANRQKICLNQVFDDLKDASNVQLLKILNDIVPYVKTNMSKENIIKTAKYALKNNWLSFKVKSSNVPEYRNDESGSGGIFYGSWCWKSDFPMDAYMLQMDIYGKSNITLARTRVNFISTREHGFRSAGDYPTSETFTNEHYGEVTTRPAEEKTTSAE